MFIDGINVGPYIRNTMAVDKNSCREEALLDIYRVMRPGDPPTYEAADALFKGLFFDKDRYDLSSVGRVKINTALDISFDDAPDTLGTLRKDDILRIVKRMVELMNGRIEVSSEYGRGSVFTVVIPQGIVIRIRGRKIIMDPQTF